MTQSRTSDHFYTDLPASVSSMYDLLGVPGLFVEVPADWFVVITDVKNSTPAVLSGLHETINLVATGSIVTALNIAYRAKITIPFFFGGDGATMLIPPSLLQPVMRALILHKENTLGNFQLDLRVGSVPVERLYHEGHRLTIAKFSLTEKFPIPVILGDGLTYSEKLVKDADKAVADHLPQDGELDLEGMQCRWDRIPPPAGTQEVVTLLVVATNGKDQAAAFRKVIGLLDRIYGNPQKRQPISVAKLRMKTTFNRLSDEMRLQLGRIRYVGLFKNWLRMLFAGIYFRTAKGRNYLNRLVEMSDTLVMDGRINTVISGTMQQQQELQQALGKLESTGEILYGLHVSRDSVMSCYVRDLEDGHIHFVDGSDGGYTMAAGMLKRKLTDTSDTFGYHR
ncbi:DUF3095 family protein [Hufsiella ginkgonis]|uniref:DUF3095 family protein n=1 Tax=Hufsiella ginkgonis TaxID=2695274 RepID=A0A7K1Y330_9SPHI|nr:DUF3095 family protein [Hufsiella ginkgonis]MXV17703.1 DUF3095 family protein [Hufsiella ginkgonis]